MVGARICSWVLLLLWSATAVYGEGASPVGAPAPSLDCTSALLGLADCLSFVQNGSTLAKPEGQCCPQLKIVVKEEVSCLCEVFKQGASFDINITKALTLPAACGVSTPSVSKCNLAIPGVPTPAPAPSPSLGAPSSVSTGVPSVSPGKSTAAAFPVPSFGFLGSMAVTLWLHYQSQGLEF